MKTPNIYTGQRISDERVRRGWKQTDLAKKTGIERTRLFRIERGAPVYLKEAVAICRELQKELEWLAGEDIENSLNGEDLKAQELYLKFPSHWRKVVNQLIKNISDRIKL